MKMSFRTPGVAYCAEIGQISLTNILLNRTQKLGNLKLVAATHLATNLIYWQQVSNIIEGVLRD